MILLLASPHYISTLISPEMPEEIADEISLQEGKEISVEVAEMGVIQAVWIGSLYVEGLFRFTPQGLEVEYVTFAIRLNDDGTVAFRFP